MNESSEFSILLYIFNDTMFFLGNNIFVMKISFKISYPFSFHLYRVVELLLQTVHNDYTHDGLEYLRELSIGVITGSVERMLSEYFSALLMGINICSPHTICSLLMM